MPTNESATREANPGAPVAKDAPTEQQASKAGVPKRFERGQTVCNEKNEKGKLHNGHLKQVSPIREEARQHMRGDDLLYRCQTCGALYMGPPLGHVRDPRKQARYVQSELIDILEAAGGTLPAFKRNESGAWVPVSETATHAPAPVAAATAQNAKPAVSAKPATNANAAPTSAADAAGETPEQKRARIIAEAKAKAAARVAGSGANAQDGAAATPTPPPAVGSAPATTGEESAARPAETTAAPPPAAPVAVPVAAQTSAAATTTAPAAPSGDETAEEKRARQMAEIKAKAAARIAAKNSPGGDAKTAGAETSIDMPPTASQPPSPTSGTDSSASADAHRPAAEAQAATGQASAAPLSPAAATASPAAGAETPADLAPDASTELTPGASRDDSALKGDE